MKSKTYFVSSINGSDSNDGLSPATAFETLGKINEIKLMPGDKVLLEKDSVFSNQYLHIKNCGKFGEDIIEITSYGDGENMPRIDADGSGIWYQDRLLPPYEPCRNDDDLVLYLSKDLRKETKRCR